jgi:hypothetical protein
MWTLTSGPQNANYVYKIIDDGDVEIIVRVVEFYNTDSSNAAEVVISLTSASIAIQCPTQMDPFYTAWFDDSEFFDTAESENATVIEDLPYWVRLTRKGNMFTGYISSDGINWTFLGRSEIDASTDNTIYLSVVNIDIDDSLGPIDMDDSLEPIIETFAEARFDSVTINPLTSGFDNDWEVSGDNMYSIPAGNVGIGWSDPLARLHVEEPGNQDPFRVRVKESTKFIVKNDGDVGIGTTNPSHKLEVRGGSIKATGGLIIETRTTDPTNPVTGQIWLLTD